MNAGNDLKLRRTRISALAALLMVSAMLLVPAACATDNIFATPSATPTMAQKYPTADALLSATRTGEIPEFFRNHPEGYSGVLFGPVIINILVKEYSLDPKYYKDGGNATRCGMMLQDLTNHDQNPQDKRSVDDFQSTQQHIPVDLREAFNKFAIRYDGIAKEYLAQVKQKEKAASEETQKQQAVKDAASRERAQRLTKILDSSEYKLWEAAVKVEQGEKLILSGQRVLDHDDEVNRASGVSDLGARRAAGEQIISGRDVVRHAFEEYRKLGGTATTPEQVVAGPEPSANFQ